MRGFDVQFPDLQFIVQNRPLIGSVMDVSESVGWGRTMHDEANCACAEYIANMCKELTDLAKENGFHVGAYMLAIAALEFANQTQVLKDDAEITLQSHKM
jgi:hypothetical protein